MQSTQPGPAAGPAAAISGVGLGLRAPHFSTILETRPAVPWFEVLIDNYFCRGGQVLDRLSAVRQDYPITFHSVGMSLGSSDPLNQAYLTRLRELITVFEPVYVSDHLCWSSIDGRYLHDLLPLPYEEAVIAHVADRIQRVQDFLRRRLLLENVSSYLHYRTSVMQEWEFLLRIVERADCDILLDINNIYVSAYNHDFDPQEYLAAVPAGRVKEFHLAGYEDQGSHLLDTHGEAVHPPVWELYRQAVAAIGPVPTLVEWDNNIPAFDVLVAEGQKAEAIMKKGQQHVA